MLPLTSSIWLSRERNASRFVSRLSSLVRLHSVVTTAKAVATGIVCFQNYGKPLTSYLYANILQSTMLRTYKQSLPIVVLMSAFIGSLASWTISQAILMFIVNLNWAIAVIIQLSVLIGISAAVIKLLHKALPGWIAVIACAASACINLLIGMKLVDLIPYPTSYLVQLVAYAIVTYGILYFLSDSPKR